MRTGMRKTSVKETNASVAERLIETAEDLYGRLGIEGVSLRQISTAAGTGNNYAVQYHFGDADGLIEAIHRERIPEVERSRARLLSAAKAAGRLKDVRTLMDILKERFTRGEIDKQEFEERRRVLGE